ncbi:hypothetical protein L249_3597, partial [Ophiocordyceps polyrhachis-furcata BCC 54312]
EWREGRCEGGYLYRGSASAESALTLNSLHRREINREKEKRPTVHPVEWGWGV